MNNYNCIMSHLVTFIIMFQKRFSIWAFNSNGLFNLTTPTTLTFSIPNKLVDIIVDLLPKSCDDYPHN